MNGVESIDAERKRQIEAEGWTNDDAHNTGALANAAVCYILHGADSYRPIRRPSLWPFEWFWWKPKDRRRDLVRAGALIAAEIDRIDRDAASPPTQTPQRSKGDNHG